MASDDLALDQRCHRGTYGNQSAMVAPRVIRTTATVPALHQLKCLLVPEAAE